VFHSGIERMQFPNGAPVVLRAEKSPISFALNSKGSVMSAAKSCSDYPGRNELMKKVISNILKQLTT